MENYILHLQLQVDIQVYRCKITNYNRYSLKWYKLCSSASTLIHEKIYCNGKSWVENKVDSNHINGMCKSRWDYRYSRQLHVATQLYLAMILLQSYTVVHLSTIEVWPDGQRKNYTIRCPDLAHDAFIDVFAKVSHDLSASR